MKLKNQIFMRNFFDLMRVITIKYCQIVWRHITFSGKPKKDISDQVVAITGAGSGIGRLIALRLATDHGARVVCIDINEESCRETVELINSQLLSVKAKNRAVGYTCDVSSRSEVYAVFDQIKAEVGNKIDILINNAGIVSGSNLIDLSDEKIEKTFQVNVVSHFWTIKSVLPAMLAEMESKVKADNRKTTVGHIVTVASITGLVGGPRMTDYSASKFAAIGLNESLTAELYKLVEEAQVRAGLKPDGTCPIKTTVVCPYMIATGMFDGVVSSVVPALVPDSVVDKIVNGILTEADMVAIPSWLIFLARCGRPLVPDNDIFWHINKLFQVDNSMDTFIGRKGGDERVSNDNKC